MTKSKRSKIKITSANGAERTSAIADIATHRVLRRTLGLSPEEIAQIDLDLAVEAGLLKKPPIR